MSVDMTGIVKVMTTPKIKLKWFSKRVGTRSNVHLQENLKGNVSRKLLHKRDGKFEGKFFKKVIAQEGWKI